MDDFNPNPALHLTSGKKVRLPIDSKFRDTTTDFTFPSSCIREKVARKIFYKLALPAELVAFEGLPAVAVLVTLSALVTEDDYFKVIGILNSRLQLKTIYGSFSIICACVSYEKRWVFIVAHVPRTYVLPQQRVLDLAASVLSKYTGITLPESNPSICALTGIVTDSKFTEFDIASQGDNDILTLVHCGRFYNCLAQKSQEDHAARMCSKAHSDTDSKEDEYKDMNVASLNTDHLGAKSPGSALSKGADDSLLASHSVLKVYDKIDDIPMELLSYAAFQLADGDPSRIVYFNSYPVVLLYIRNATINEPLDRFYSSLRQWNLCVGAFADVDNCPISEFKNKNSYVHESATRGRTISSNQSLTGRRNSRANKEDTVLTAVAVTAGVVAPTGGTNPLSLTQHLRTETKGRVHVVLFLKRLVENNSDPVKDAHKLLIKSGKLLASPSQYTFLSCAIDYTDDYKEIYLNVGGITDNSCVKIIESLLVSKNCRDIKINITLGTVSFLAKPSIFPVVTNKIKALGFTCKQIVGTDIADETSSILVNTGHIRRWVVQFVINLVFLLLTSLFSFGYLIFPENSGVNTKLNSSFITVSDTISLILALFCIFTNSGYLILKYGLITLYNKTFSNETLLAFILLIGLIVSVNSYVWSLSLKQTSRLPLMFDSLVILIAMVSLCKIVELRAKQLSAKPYIDLAHSIPSETVVITDLLMPEVAKHFYKDANNLLDANAHEDTDQDQDECGRPKGKCSEVQDDPSHIVPSTPTCDLEASPRLPSEPELLKKPASADFSVLPIHGTDSFPALGDLSGHDTPQKVPLKRSSIQHSPRNNNNTNNNKKHKRKLSSSLRRSLADDSLFTSPPYSNDTSIITVELTNKHNPLYNLLIKTYKIDKVVDHLTGQYKEDFSRFKFANIQTRTLTKGNIVRVQAGYRCPCDGIVVYGSTEVDERYISGRRMMSAVKQMGDVIYAGTRVLYSDLYVCCVAINQETVIGQIFSLLQRSQKAGDRLPKIHTLANKILEIAGPVILCSGVLLFIVWITIAFTSDSVYSKILHIFGIEGAENMSPNLIKTIFSCYVMLAFFIAGCSSALAIAFPIISLSGSTKAQKMGFVMRNCCLLSEQLADIEHIVFSKSGTLTLAQPVVESILIPFNVDAMFAFFEATGQIVKVQDGYIVRRPIVKPKEPDTLATIFEEKGSNQQALPKALSFAIATPETANVVCSVNTMAPLIEETETPFSADNDTPGPLLSMFAHPDQERRMSATTIDALNAVVAVGDLGAIELVGPRDDESAADTEGGSTPMVPISLLQLSNVDAHLPNVSSIGPPESAHRLSSPANMTRHISANNSPELDTLPPKLGRSNSMLLQPNMLVPSVADPQEYSTYVYTKEELCATMNTDALLARMRDKFIYSVAIKCLKYYGSFAHHSGNPIIYSLLTCIVLFAKGKPMNHVVRNISNLSEFSLPEAKDFAIHQDRGGFSATMGGEEIYCGNFYHEKKDVGELSHRECKENSTISSEVQQYVKINPQTFKYEFINVTSTEQLESHFDNHDYAALYIRGELISTITVSDTIRPDSFGTTYSLRKSGYNVNMITADTQHSAFKIAEKVGIPRNCVIYDLPVHIKPDAIRFLALHDRWPTQKEILSLFSGWKSEEWQQKQQKVLFVCDGINDISCLPACGVSVAVGSGEQILKNSADVVLLSNRLSDILQMLRFSATVRKFMLAIFLVSILYSVVFLVLTSGVLLPVLFVVSPTYSALAIAALVLILIAIGLSLNLYCEKHIVDVI